MKSLLKFIFPFHFASSYINWMESVNETLRRAREVEERYKQFLVRKVEQDKSIEETFKKIDRTQETLKQTRETIGAIDQLYVRLETVLSQSIDAAVKSIEKNHPLTVSQPGFQPNRVTAKTVAAMLKDKKRIMILTGAGISAASGIPTFRSNNGFWNKQKVEIQSKQGVEKIEPQTILTNKFYEALPAMTWKWLNDFYNLKIKAKPNRGHLALNDILEQLARKGKEVCLVTQNIDNFHVEVQQLSKKSNKRFKSYPIYEIHGNILKIRCNNCSLKDKAISFKPYQKFIQIIETKKKAACPKCEQSLRPHIMFFDEFYEETFNRCDTIRTFLKDTDAVLVIGTALQTGFANEIVTTAFEEEKQIVELNTACQIRRSKVWWMQGKADQALEQIKANVYKK